MSPVVEAPRHDLVGVGEREGVPSAGENGDRSSGIARKTNRRGAEENVRVSARADAGSDAAELTLRAGARGEHRRLRMEDLPPTPAPREGAGSVNITRCVLPAATAAMGEGVSTRAMPCCRRVLSREKPISRSSLKTPQPRHGTVGEERERGGVGGGGADDDGVGVRAGDGHLTGDGGGLVVVLGDGSAELALVVDAPRPKVAILRDGDRVHAGGDRDRALGEDATVAAGRGLVQKGEGDGTLAAGGARRQAEDHARVVAPHKHVARDRLRGGGILMSS